LRVISRMSVLRYKQSKLPLSQIAQELNVDAIIEGTVLRSGDKLRVTVQLIRVSPEAHLWSERYERDVSNVIPLEKDLALAIAHAITGHLPTAEETAISNPKTTNPKAYEAYLRGRDLWKDRTQKAAAGAGAYFEEAVREDPNFALAFSGLLHSELGKLGQCSAGFEVRAKSGRIRSRTGRSACIIRDRVGVPM